MGESPKTENEKSIFGNIDETTEGTVKENDETSAWKIARSIKRKNKYQTTDSTSNDNETLTRGQNNKFKLRKLIGIKRLAIEKRSRSNTKRTVDHNCQQVNKCITASEKVVKAYIVDLSKFKKSIKTQIVGKPKMSKKNGEKKEAAKTELPKKKKKR